MTIISAIAIGAGHISSSYRHSGPLDIIYWGYPKGFKRPVTPAYKPKKWELAIMFSAVAALWVWILILIHYC